MKITPHDYATLETAMHNTLAAHGLCSGDVKHIRHAWDLFHKAWTEKRFDGNALYKKYADAHFETAFRRAFSL